MNRYTTNKIITNRKPCPECGLALCSPKIWEGVEICYPCYRQHITSNSLPIPSFKKNIYKERLYK